MVAKKIKTTITGKPSYEKWTLHQWVLEVKDLLEEEYGVEIIVESMDTGDVEPGLLINDQLVLKGLPGEEGYLIEVLKKAFEEILGLRRS